MYVEVPDPVIISLQVFFLLFHSRSNGLEVQIYSYNSNRTDLNIRGPYKDVGEVPDSTPLSRFQSYFRRTGLSERSEKVGYGVRRSPRQNNRLSHVGAFSACYIPFLGDPSREDKPTFDSVERWIRRSIYIFFGIYKQLIFYCQCRQKILFFNLHFIC